MLLKRENKDKQVDFPFSFVMTGNRGNHNTRQSGEKQAFAIFIVYWYSDSK